MWRRYFKLVKLVPGKVIVQGYGTLDFAGDVPIEICKALYETDFEFLEITEEGKRALYGIQSLEFKEPKTLNTKPETENPEPVTSDQEPVTKKRPTRKNKKDV